MTNEGMGLKEKKGKPSQDPEKGKDITSPQSRLCHHHNPQIRGLQQQRFSLVCATCTSQAGRGTTLIIKTQADNQPPL